MHPHLDTYLWPLHRALQRDLPAELECRVRDAFLVVGGAVALHVSRGDAERLSAGQRAQLDLVLPPLLAEAATYPPRAA